MPEKYTGLEVSKMTITANGNTYDLGTDLDNVILPDTLKTTTADHGENYIEIVGTIGSSNYNLKYPVTLITSYISTIDEFSALTHLDSTETKKTITGYYKAAADLSFNVTSYVELSSENYNTFSGTFDGNGKTFTSKSRIAGLFGKLSDATIKNLTITDGYSYGGIDSSCCLLSRDMISTKIEDVTFKVTGKTNRTINTSLAITAQNYGWINCRIAQNCSFTNCTFDGGTDSLALNIQTLIGTHSSCVGDTFSNCTFNCNSYYCLYQSSYTNLVTTTQDGLTITGTCVYSA